ncbi:hypothetical protein HYH03_002658 [Edaphochlamys debaryana]|uniref:Uncharacterized protein n=1 Tax=Edaphochlamys debaryana TaxID=47281 RepID=A0A835YDJ1_9CHLO|nr:hypothetical protein HYH03_002658 [Edaphochlamys debaryana]|eukprot:KAG2499724.1 hypothetical protein HYH03_002658 [Edaphochlamys debaryana]
MARAKPAATATTAAAAAAARPPAARTMRSPSKKKPSQADKNLQVADELAQRGVRVLAKVVGQTKHMKAALDVLNSARDQASPSSPALSEDAKRVDEAQRAYWRSIAIDSANCSHNSVADVQSELLSRRQLIMSNGAIDRVNTLEGVGVVVPAFIKDVVMCLQEGTDTAAVPAASSAIPTELLAEPPAEPPTAAEPPAAPKSTAKKRKLPASADQPAPKKRRPTRKPCATAEVSDTYMAYLCDAINLFNKHRNPALVSALLASIGLEIKAPHINSAAERDALLALLQQHTPPDAAAPTGGDTVAGPIAPPAALFAKLTECTVPELRLRLERLNDFRLRPLYGRRVSHVMPATRHALWTVLRSHGDVTTRRLGPLRALQNAYAELFRRTCPPVLRTRITVVVQRLRAALNLSDAEHERVSKYLEDLVCTLSRMPRRSTLALNFAYTAALEADDPAVLEALLNLLSKKACNQTFWKNLLMYLVAGRTVNNAKFNELIQAAMAVEPPTFGLERVVLNDAPSAAGDEDTEQARKERAELAAELHIAETLPARLDQPLAYAARTLRTAVINMITSTMSSHLQRLLNARLAAAQAADTASPKLRDLTGYDFQQAVYAPCTNLAQLKADLGLTDELLQLRAEVRARLQVGESASETLAPEKIAKQVHNFYLVMRFNHWMAGQLGELGVRGLKLLPIGAMKAKFVRLDKKSLLALAELTLSTPDRAALMAYKTDAPQKKADLADAKAKFDEFISPAALKKIKKLLPQEDDDDDDDDDDDNQDDNNNDNNDGKGNDARNQGIAVNSEQQLTLDEQLKQRLKELGVPEKALPHIAKYLEIWSELNALEQAAIHCMFAHVRDDNKTKKNKNKNDADEDLDWAKDASLKDAQLTAEADADAIEAGYVPASADANVDGSDDDDNDDEGNTAAAMACVGASMGAASVWAAKPKAKRLEALRHAAEHKAEVAATKAREAKAAWVEAVAAADAAAADAAAASASTSALTSTAATTAAMTATTTQAKATAARLEKARLAAARELVTAATNIAKAKTAAKVPAADTPAELAEHEAARKLVTSIAGKLAILGIDPGRTCLATVVLLLGNDRKQQFEWRLTRGQYHNDSGCTAFLRKQARWLAPLQGDFARMGADDAGLKSGQLDDLVAYNRAYLAAADKWWASALDMRVRCAAFSVHVGKQRTLSSFASRVLTLRMLLDANEATRNLDILVAYGSAGPTMKPTGRGELAVPTTGMYLAFERAVKGPHGEAVRALPSPYLENEAYSTKIDNDTEKAKLGTYRHLTLARVVPRAAASGDSPDAKPPPPLNEAAPPMEPLSEREALELLLAHVQQYCGASAAAPPAAPVAPAVNASATSNDALKVADVVAARAELARAKAEANRAGTLLRLSRAADKPARLARTDALTTAKTAVKAATRALRKAIGCAASCDAQVNAARDEVARAKTVANAAKQAAREATAAASAASNQTAAAQVEGGAAGSALQSCPMISTVKPILPNGSRNPRAPVATTLSEQVAVMEWTRRHAVRDAIRRGAPRATALRDASRRFVDVALDVLLRLLATPIADIMEYVYVGRDPSAAGVIARLAVLELQGAPRPAAWCHQPKTTKKTKQQRPSAAAATVTTEATAAAGGGSGAGGSHDVAAASVPQSSNAPAPATKSARGHARQPQPQDSSAAAVPTTAGSTQRGRQSGGDNGDGSGGGGRKPRATKPKPATAAAPAANGAPCSFSSSSSPTQAPCTLGHN